jgi:protein-L-isoaspartate(D-aspartate) O-methyltransferase
VYTIEIIEEMGQAAAERLQRLGYVNVTAKVGDGYQGWPEQAPFDKIIVTCSPEKLPQPLVDQLREGGRMLIPLGESFQQTLYLLKKENGKMVSQPIEPTFFVPMTGRADSMRSAAAKGPLSSLINNGFEDHQLFPDRPDGWYYLRHARLDNAVLAGHGKQCLTFANDEPGRGSQALQGIAVDGRVVRSVDVSAWVRCDNVHFGQAPDQLPRVLITFFDEQRGAIAQQTLGPWDGSFSWSQKRTMALVPPAARLAIVAIGLLGATGEVSFDDIEIRPSPEAAAHPAATNSDAATAPPGVKRALR